MFTAAEAEGTGHATAAEFGRFHLEPDLFEQLHFGVELQDRPLVAMSVNDGLSAQLRRLIARHFVRQKFAEQKTLFAEAFRILVVREKIEHLIAENGETAWLQADDRDAAANFRPQRFENLAQQGLCRLEHAGVIQGPSAT